MTFLFRFCSLRKEKVWSNGRGPHCETGQQEAALQAIADKFIAQHKGDAVKALKEMIVLNGCL
ncbi:hypothetical protein NKH70_28240 [Mesorhizobium sp. M0991]|uniref:hypothetical protein n=1 Tax=unclassified Mesorhizobium TaxID=325217 RepID=UPI00333C7C52